MPVDSAASCVLMGGSGSTGSTLLRTILNRHHELYSGDELSFFNKEQYFENWQKYKHRISNVFRRHLATKGWFPYPGHALFHQDYFWTGPALKQLVREAPSIEVFSRAFFEEPLRRAGKRIWIEKTPSNAYAFRQFLRAFPDGRVVHTSRNPLDAVASLVRRGLSPYFASCLWLYNTASALSVADDPRYLLLRYEDLMEDPEGTTRQTCRFIGVEFLPSMLSPSRADTTDHARNPGWRHDRLAPVSKADTPTFALLSAELQQEIRGTLSAVRVSKKHQRAKKIRSASCADCCAALGYAFEENDVVDGKRLWLAYVRDVFHRTRMRYPTGVWFYPVELRL